MKFLICLCACIATVNAAYDYLVPTTKLGAPLLYGAVNVLPPPVSQFFTQDALGQYTYGYSEPLSSKQESRTADGVTRGTYSYLDAAGRQQTVDYTADVGGFRVAATNLPQTQLKPVEETAEVAALRAQHLAAHEAVKLRLAAGSDDVAVAAGGLPTPVEDTPEVAAAKVEFFKRFEAEKLRHELLSGKNVLRTQSVLVKSTPIYVKSTPLAVLPISGFGYKYKIGADELSREYLPSA